MSRMWIAHACACVALALPAVARGGEVTASLAIVPGDAAAFITVDVPGVLNSPLCDEVRFALGAIKPAELAAFAKKFPVDPTTIERVVVVLPTAATVTDPFPNLHPTAVSALAIVGCSKPFDPATLGKGFYPAGRPKSYRGRVYHFDEDSWSGLLVLPDNRTFVIGAEDSLVWLIDRLGKDEVAGPLSPARAEAAEHTAFVAVNPLAAITPTTQLPPALRPLADARRICLAIDLGKSIKASIEFHYADADGAVAGETAVKKAVGFAREKLKELEVDLKKVIDRPAQDGRTVSPGEFPERVAALIAVGALRRIDEAVEKLPVERKGATVRVAVDITVPQGGAGIVVLGFTAVTALGQNANSTFQYVGDSIKPGGVPIGPAPEETRLKKLAAAFDAYHAEHGHYPSVAIAAKDGTPLLSWRVALLPYLGEKKLYDEFRQNEPWDSLHNKKLLAKMPDVFNKPYAYPQNYGRTNAQVVTGPGTLFDGARVKKPAGGATILVLESGAGETVWWTKPADRITAAGKPPELFMNYESSSCWAAFSDGTIKRLTKKDDEKQLPALVARPMDR
jgi:Protein of unknown function (DUF1559)